MSKTKVFVLSPIFPPEPIVGAQTALAIAKKLKSIGYEVSVITSFPSRPGGKLYPGYQRCLFRKERHPDGFDIIRCFSIPSYSSTLLSRFIENVTFGISAALFLSFSPKCALLHSNTWPIFASGLMSLVCKLRRIPYIIRVVDLYPESIVSQKRSHVGQWVLIIMRKIDRRIAAGAAHITVLTDYFKRIYVKDRGIAPQRISIIPDWVETDLDSVEVKKANLVRRQFCIPNDSFLVGYGGNIGTAAGVDTLIKACAHIDGIHALIAGDGSQLTACKKLAAEIAPEKISFFSPWPKEETMSFYQAADVLVLPTHGGQSLVSIPSKLIRYMLSSRPIIAASLPDTELARIIDHTQCGWIVPPDDPFALQSMIVRAKNVGQVERTWRGVNGRDYALKNFTADAALPKLLEIIKTILMEKYDNSY